MRRNVAEMGNRRTVAEIVSGAVGPTVVDRAPPGFVHRSSARRRGSGPPTLTRQIGPAALNTSFA